jgi:hypothetical protein
MEKLLESTGKLWPKSFKKETIVPMVVIGLNLPLEMEEEAGSEMCLPLFCIFLSVIAELKNYLRVKISSQLYFNHLLSEVRFAREHGEEDSQQFMSSSEDNLLSG